MPKDFGRRRKRVESPYPFFESFRNIFRDFSKIPILHQVECKITNLFENKSEIWYDTPTLYST